MNLRAPFLAVALGTACSCAAWKRNGAEPDKTPTQPAATAPELIGRIASVPKAQGFALIQTYGPWRAAIGTILTTRGPHQRSANLRVTGESLGRFAAADIQSGSVEVGDAVYSHHLPKPETNPAETPAEAPASIPPLDELPTLPSEVPPDTTPDNTPDNTPGALPER